MASERKLRKRAMDVVTTNLKAEAAPFTFPLKSAGEEIRVAPIALIPEIKVKVFQLLNGNCR